MTKARDNANRLVVDQYINTTYGPDITNSSTTVPAATGFPVFKVPAKTGDVLVFSLNGAYDGFDMIAAFDLKILKSGIYWGSNSTTFRGVGTLNPPGLYSYVRGTANYKVASSDIDTDGTVSVTLMCLKSSGSANTNRFGLNQQITSVYLANVGPDYVS